MFPKYANEIGWSQVYPYEVVKVVSDKTIEVRAMETERDPAWKPEILPGGFVGHCINQSEQTWFYHSAPNNPVKRLRLNKKGQWVHKGSRFVLADAPRYFYDYNF